MGKRAPCSVRTIARLGALALACGPLLLFPARTTAGEPHLEHKEQVLALYTISRQLLDTGRIDEACAVLEQGRRLDPTAINLLLRLGECHQRKGRTARAWNVFGEAAAIARRAGDPRATRAAALAAALEPELSRLTIAVTAQGAAPGLEIRCDGKRIPPAQYGQPLPTDPGTHVIEATAPGKKPWLTTETVEAGGDRVLIEVPVLEDADGRPTREAPDRRSAPSAAVPARRTRGATPPSSRGPARAIVRAELREQGGLAQRVLAVASGVAGIAGLGTGTIFGLTALSKRDASNQGHCDGRSRCDAVGVSLREDAQAAATASTIAFSTGAGALVGALVLWWTAPPRHPDGRGRDAARAGPSGAPLASRPPRSPSAFVVIDRGAGTLGLRGSF